MARTSRMPLGLRLLLACALLGTYFGAKALGLLTRSVVSVLVILVGLGAIWVAVRMDERRRDEIGRTPGPSWLIGSITSKLPLPAAQGLWFLMGIGIAGLGVFSLVAAS